MLISGQNKSLIISIIILSIVTMAAGKIIYVDSDANGMNDGTSWENAYNFLQDALADANSSPKPVEILVAEGIYTPDSNSAVPDGTGDREATFQLINGVTLKGGYAGTGQPDSNTRDIELYETVLSGDLDSNDVDITEPYDLLEEPSRAENSYHVVNGSGTDVNAILDGLTICSGHAEGEGWPIYQNGGGGIYNRSGSPKIINCRIIANTAGEGGGIWNYDGSPILSNCTFRKNAAYRSGGGIKNRYGTPTLTDCIFNNNAAEYGGGIYGTYYGWFSISNCRITRNSAQYGGGLAHFQGAIRNSMVSDNSAHYYGGGMYNSEDNPIVLNCIFSGNTAGNSGGGLYNNGMEGGSHPILIGCTFAGNFAPNGNAIGCDSYNQIYPHDVDVANCILWDGGEEIWNNDESIITITFSDLEGGQAAIYDPGNGVIWGEGNIDVDPLFADTDANDFHLQSQAGRWDPNCQTWIKDNVTSPCIDAGDMSNPIGYESFPNGGRVNMGAYGGTAEASKSYFGEPPCEIVVAGDINGDCIVNFKDFAFMAYHWLENNNP